MFKKIIFLLFAFFLLFQATAYAAPPDEVDLHETFIRGEVIKVEKQGVVRFAGSTTYQATFKVQLSEGKEKGKMIEVSHSGDPKTTGNKINEGDIVVIDSKPDQSGKMLYTVYEPYRLNVFIFALLCFLVLIVLIGGKKGIGAFIGLIISLLVISQWIIPQIIQGNDPLQVAIIGSFDILIVTTYIAHGFSLKTTIAVIATAIALAFTGWLSTQLVQVMHLFGLGNEDIYQLQVGTPHPINAQGLLLGGILIGTLGALNDITTTQAVTMFTLVKENPKQKFSEVFGKGMEIGKEHIASLVNTLVLAYAGSSLAIFIFFALNPAQLPWWVILNNETTMEEIARTLVGSSALILAVPLTTLLATFVAVRGTNFPDFVYVFLKEVGIIVPEKRTNQKEKKLL